MLFKDKRDCMWTLNDPKLLKNMSKSILSKRNKFADAELTLNAFKNLILKKNISSNYDHIIGIVKYIFTD
jgi:hypothetical protein